MSKIGRLGAILGIGAALAGGDIDHERRLSEASRNLLNPKPSGIRRVGANTDEGQYAGCKNGLKSGGTKRRRAQYQRARLRALYRPVERKPSLSRLDSGRITGEGDYGANDGR